MVESDISMVGQFGSVEIIPAGRSGFEGRVALVDAELVDGQTSSVWSAVRLVIRIVLVRRVTRGLPG
ncbi:hypothetical protein [Streptomyces coffeae]|uniref:Uncharacterized protein n=1 Tax=Streptomyces coffeae TaxID=621382 RepID=A0ABS1N8U3_9ACTN|nr:hypothetical protein [Streptomyces coffeae]